ncbi:MAG: hypothetical protein KBT39_12245 [Bacteroidales bacterium]|nr:hypothetical protein [Bacteroidales bacterium]
MKKFFTLIAAMVASTFSMMAQDPEWGDNINPNSDFEGTDFSWVAAKSSDGALYVASEEIATNCINEEDGNHFLQVYSKENPAYPWDAQYWIVLPSDVEVGEQFYISFKYRARWNDDTVESMTVGSQGHTTPGNYLDNNGIGDLEFTKEWKEFEGVFKPSNGQRSIAFNLAQSQGAFEAYYDLDDLVIKREKADESLVPYWKKIVTNGDFEGDNTTNYIVRIKGGSGDYNPTPEEGIGVDGSKGIKMTVPGKNGGDSWASQFFIKLNEALPDGEMLKVSFDYRADADMTNAVETQAHGSTAGGYNHHQCIGNPKFTSEWQHYEYTVAVTGDMSKSDNVFQHIAFNLAVDDEVRTLYFDNIQCKHKVMVPLGDNPAALDLQEYMDELNEKYAEMNLSAFKANSAIRDEFSQAFVEAQSLADDADYEAVNDELRAVESKFANSIKDYTNLFNHINMIKEKAELASDGGFIDLSTALEAIIEPLESQYEEEVWTKEDIIAAIDDERINNMCSESILANMKAGDNISAIIVNPKYTFGSMGWNGGVTVNWGAAERYHTGFDVSQTIKGLKKGAYVIKVNGFQRIDDEGDMNAVLYANAASKLLVNRDLADDAPEGDAPNDMGSAANAFADGCYANELSAVLTEDGDLKIGVKGTDTHIWTIWDNFQIIYKGEDKAVLAQAILDQVDATENVEFNLEFDELLNNEIIEKEGNLVSAARKMADNIATASEEEINKMIADLQNIIDEMNEVSKVVKTVQDAYTAYQDTYDEYYEEAPADVKGRADKVTAILNSEDGFLALSTEELKTFASELVDLSSIMKIKAAAFDATDAAPFDFTYLFVDPDFEDYAEVGANKNYPGWSGSGFGTGGGTAGPVAERWNQANGFDTYVDFSYLPAGTYSLTCDGASRYGANGDIVANDYAILMGEKENDKPVYLYATTSLGTDEALLHNICEGKMTEAEAEKVVNTEENSNIIKITIDDVVYYVPDQLATADSWIQAGKYLKNEVIFKVPADGKARVGIKKASGVANDWVFADNFALTYYGANSEKVPTAIEDIQVAPVAAAKGIFTISGVRINSAKKAGLYIINGKKVMVK